ncbi:hypothetical protein BDM02DRAFT_3158602 [Thelephora ganbajun]|uniref:Uncharacterized protein n=1 Tax=Thelephora ganbajun TaxID=370292 RepID=A0ACB6ZWY2_THEGA|nr:hypothetical protein BDM02DRAFT_3158602 [Thelephora ganbajun]
MPGISRFKQVAAEAKFNVTTEFANLGLHSAAASGDYGLVRYAIANGQPINSVLHGVLPIHVACSGGDEQVVNLLIDNGADVNAPRLPLRYTSDKNRDTSAPIVGTSGSTPLHFACANGHVNVVIILLQHGAHPDRADKHGVTPEALARESGHENCAETIRRWIEQKDEDLKNRAEYPYDGPSSSTADGSSRKRLHVKRSIDNALSLFRTHSSTPLTPPPTHSPTASLSNSPLNEYDLGLDSNTPGDEDHQKTRRPSIPFQYNTLPTPKPSTGTSSRRPRSAGTGAEGPTQRQQNLGAGRTSSKYSLRNLLRKQSQVSLVESDSPSRPSLSISPNSSDKHTRKASIDSPVGEMTPSRFKSRFGSDAADRPLMAAELHNQLALEDLYSESAVDGSPSNSPAPTGILRGHSRSSSISQRPTSRTLRFDSNSSAPGLLTRRTSSPRRVLTLNGSSSIGSLRGMVSTARLPSGRDTPESAPPASTQFSDLQDGDGSKDGEIGARSYERSDRLGELRSEGRTADKGINSSTSSLSRGAGVSRSNDFPFSIHNPPPNGEHDPATSNLESNGSGDARLRGHSISSVSTDLSVDNPALSSSTTSASASITVPTPALNNSPLPVSEDSLSTKRHYTPIDIDISAISSHAQAEALVQRTQKSILEMDDEIPLSSAALSSGRSPLSAKLAMYGETLELERRLKKEEEDRKAAETPKSAKSLTTPTLQSPDSSSPKKIGLERQFSLEENSPTPRRRKARRPHTAGDEAPRPFGMFWHWVFLRCN